MGGTVWAAQQLGTFGDGRYEGVSALWYGKRLGVDRSGDAFKHRNQAGSARRGGVVADDDHTCKSSTTAHQSEFALVDCNNRCGCNAACRVEVLPLHGFGCLVVVAEVAHEFSLQVGVKCK